jgi:hypothetical protein
MMFSFRVKLLFSQLVTFALVAPSCPAPATVVEPPPDREETT